MPSDADQAVGATPSEESETALAPVARVDSPPTPYSPDSYHPLMMKEEGDGNGRSNYAEYYAMVRAMVDREISTLGQYVQSGWYRDDFRRKSLVTKHLSLIHI